MLRAALRSVVLYKCFVIGNSFVDAEARAIPLLCSTDAVVWRLEIEMLNLENEVTSIFKPIKDNMLIH